MALLATIYLPSWEAFWDRPGYLWGEVIISAFFGKPMLASENKAEQSWMGSELRGNISQSRAIPSSLHSLRKALATWTPQTSQ